MQPLFCELVPRPLWGVNLRKYLTTAEWKDCQRVSRLAGPGCQECGNMDSVLQCHERWTIERDLMSKTALQRLSILVAICADCHAIHHFGRTGQVASAIQISELKAHWCRINKITLNEIETHLHDAGRQWKIDSTFTWQIDMSPIFDMGVALTPTTVSNIKELATTKWEPLAH